MTICVVVLNLFLYISIILQIIKLSMLSFCISLLRFKYPQTRNTYPKTVSKASWYKSISNFFSNYIFEENIIYNPRYILLLFDWAGILCFTFSSLFKFFSVYFHPFFNVFCTPSHNQENHNSK